MTRRNADLLLIAATLIWGVTFVVIKDALAAATPLAFLAVRFAGQIVAVAELSRRHDPMRLVWMQTAGTAALAAVAALTLEHPHLGWSPRLVAQLGWASVCATALALLWQMKAQREMSSARA